ncbi:hypothetical protein BCR43DRAFT_486532 [Syncephalastrum racemosum]|uniref:IPT/TIG domain-containing protein n=1 Tax=Syncephalastrum racemosum TaxID=13706 RepID=A0A1X2HP88_SYNRA|nr:hypothetical protein BCR43DRAFT_486532 [Syncephalastrum racemosum]
MSPQAFKADATMSNGYRIAIVGVPSKSRVETQIKLCIQLLTDKGAKVSNWPYLKLPDHLLARSRLRRQQKAASPMATDLPADQEDQAIIHLDARVACASRPNDPVKMCIGCIQRERKRAERSKNAHLSDLPDKAFPEEDRVLLFNCGPIVNFDSGDAVLPTRITCYCRHHGEREGFCIHFTLRDNNGDVVATGVSPPILITDDHKSSYRKTSASSSATRTKAVDRATASTGRKRSRAEMIEEDGKSFSKSPKDDTLCASPHSLCSFPTPASSRRGSQEEQPSNSSSNGEEDAEGPPTHGVPSSSAASRGVGAATALSITSPAVPLLLQSRPSTPLLPTPDQEYAELQSFFSPAFFSSDQRQQQPPPTQTQAVHPDTIVHRPVLERLVPAQGPTYGGIEVTVLGSGFTRETTCLFGEHEATTVFWNPNTLVCLLPAASQPAPVVVSFKQQPILLGASQGVPLFTYYDANDHALLELALQVVGLKMTGKLQDAKQIAMRIVQGDDVWMRHTLLTRHQPQHLPISSSTPSSPSSLLHDHC